jgi:hyperosmotically inducible protein
MKQITACLVVLALFVLFVGSRFKPSDGERLAAISRMTAGKVRNAMPPSERIAAPINALRGELPEPLDGRVKARLNTDKKLEGVDFAVSAEGDEVKLRGIVPNSASRRRAIELAENTTGVSKVVDELAVPGE